jgi:hypothetical protein
VIVQNDELLKRCLSVIPFLKQMLVREHIVIYISSFIQLRTSKNLFLKPFPNIKLKEVLKTMERPFQTVPAGSS